MQHLMLWIGNISSHSANPPPKKSKVNIFLQCPQTLLSGRHTMFNFGAMKPALIITAYFRSIHNSLFMQQLSR